MSKLTRVMSDKYVTVSNRIAKDETVSLKARGLLFTIMTLSADWDFTVKGLVSITKEGKTAIYSAIDELIVAGYCSREAVRADDGKILHYDYTFYENPNVSRGEEPLSGFLETDNQEIENPPQYKKSKEYKNKNNDICEVFEFWKQTMSLNGGTKLTAERQRKIQARLRDGYTLERIKNAVRGCSISPHHCGQNDTHTVYNDIELICRTGSKLEFFENKWLTNESTKPVLNDNAVKTEAALREMYRTMIPGNQNL